MPENIRILSTRTGGGDQYELLVDSSFILLNKYDFVSVFLSLNSWVINLGFYDNDNINPLTSSISLNGSSIIISHNKWYGDDWIEYAKPYVIETTDKSQSISIMVRSTATRTQNTRRVELTVWKKLRKTNPLENLL
ncbi:MAG TPA: hypothetical protein VN698_01725 [Bacteroidia bacterium]|nr:hypothetical protein [Bacteroidia bacterium]